MKLRGALAVVMVLVVGGALIGTAGRAEAQPIFLTYEQVEARIAPAVPMIETPYGNGSGVLVGPRRVLTNAHVLYPFNSATVTFTTGQRFHDVPVVAWDLTADMVVLQLPSDAPVAPLPIVSEAGSSIGTPVYSIGYPRQADQSTPLTVLAGRINRFRTWPGVDVTYVQTDMAVAGGMSGGAVITSAGDLIAFNEWSVNDQESVGPSAVDVIARLDAELAGQDVDHLGSRYPETVAPPVNLLEFTLLDGRDERVFMTSPDLLGTFSLVVTASEAAWVGAVWPDGTVIDSSSSDKAFDHVLEFFVTGVGVPFYVIVDQQSDTPGTYEMHAGVDLFPLEDSDDRRVITKNQLVFGHTDYPLDRDTFIVPLTAGQTLSVEVQSLLVDEFVAVEQLQSGTVEVLAWDDDSGGGVWRLDPYLSFVAPEDGEYFLVVGGLVDMGVGGYIANIQITDSISAIGGTFNSQLPSDGLTLTSWGGGSIEEVVAAASVQGCTLESFWIATSGDLIGYLVGAPGFVNGPVTTLYAEGVPARTPMLVSCGA